MEPETHNCQRLPQGLQIKHATYLTQNDDKFSIWQLENDRRLILYEVYYCPYCGNKLNVDNSIVVTVPKS